MQEKPLYKSGLVMKRLDSMYEFRGSNSIVIDIPKKNARMITTRKAPITNGFTDEKINKIRR